MNGYQKIFSAVAFSFYCLAFLHSLEMTATRDLMMNNHSQKLETWKIAACFGVGAAVWVVSLVLLRIIKHFEVRLGRLQNSIRGQVYLLLLVAPGLFLFLSLSGIYSKYFTGSAGSCILSMLSLSSFILDLTFPHQIEFGQVDMFEGVHLPILPSIEEPFYIVFGVAFVYYLRKFILLAFNEIIKEYRGLPQEEQIVTPTEEITAAENSIITIAELIGDSLIDDKVQQLLNDADEYVKMTTQPMFRKVFEGAFNREEIDLRTFENFNQKLDRLVSSVETVRLCLQQNQV